MEGFNLKLKAKPFFKRLELFKYRKDCPRRLEIWIFFSLCFLLFPLLLLHLTRLLYLFSHFLLLRLLHILILSLFYAYNYSFSALLSRVSTQLCPLLLLPYFPTFCFVAKPFVSGSNISDLYSRGCPYLISACTPVIPNKVFNNFFQPLSLNYGTAS